METLESFYSDPRRQDSREVRFGSSWRSHRPDHFQFVVFWIADTQELCLLQAPVRDVQSDGVFSRFILDVPPHFNPQPPRDGEIRVEVLAKVPEDELESLLEGWQEHMTEAGGIGWLRDALADG